MTQKIVDAFNKAQLKEIPHIVSGDTVKIHQKIKEKDKERIQVYEGLVIAKKHGDGINGTITVRKVSAGVGVEKVFPIHSPFIAKIEVVKKSKVRRAKLYYIRSATGKKARLKRKDFAEFAPAETKKETPAQEMSAPVEAPENQEEPQK